MIIRTITDESLLRRPGPTIPYQKVAVVLSISDAVITETKNVLKPYTLRELEGCCFWYGKQDHAGNGKVEAVIMPKQRNTWGNYSIHANAMAEVSHATRPFGWRNLAQIHTHPGNHVEHSVYDDQHANSQKSLSLVIPRYGKWNGIWPNGIGIHEYQNGYWHLLTTNNASSRVVVQGSGSNIRVIDLR